MNRNTIIGLLVSSLLGALIWILSPYFSGAPEPWDAESPYYLISLLISGAIVGVLCRKCVWVVFPGIIFGQLFYGLLFLPVGPLWGVGVVFMAAYALFAVLGAYLVSHMWGKESANPSSGHGA